MQCTSLSATRRTFLQIAGAALGSSLMPFASGTAARRATKKVAAIVTIYRYNSHTDVLIGKILEGWKQDGGPGPDLELASMYVDQFVSDDMARDKSKEFGFPLYDNIQDAITLGTNRVAVDGIISVGEHGDYPWNDIGQHLYPRRRFFKAITDTLEKFGPVVPVFNDKHPGPVWDDAKWMYDRAKELNIPFMAGSSLPVSYRKPDFSLPMGADLEACLGIGYSGLDIYGFHTLDYLQCIIERRKCAQQGVEWVRCLPGSRLSELIDYGVIRRDMLAKILEVTPTADGSLLDANSDEFNIFLIQYKDGLLAPVMMLPGYSQAISAVVKVRGQDPVGGVTEERPVPRHPHFAYLLKGIEQMVHTGQPSYPVERTVLVAGVLDRLLNSRAQDGKKLVTPELDLNYAAVDYPHAPHLDLAHSFVN